ncbi:hypothetical protein SH248x_002419 [Planctomycetaceae bacterium SH248]
MEYRKTATFIALMMFLCIGCDSGSPDHTLTIPDEEQIVLVVKNIEPILKLDEQEIRLVDQKIIHDQEVVSKWLSYFPDDSNQKDELIGIGASSRASVDIIQGGKRLRIIGIDEDLAWWTGNSSHVLDDSFPAFFAEQMRVEQLVSE